ncbi:hypothetical protein [Saccharicrinis sp. FJH54]|uniref:hypothetical protein n=1 Tax=Saccharicrinis sp. FJH54 TaxID=3344665 RepID=UPI0035D48110
MKRISCLLLLICILSLSAVADVIYSPYKDGGVALSLEGIASYEFSFTQRNTVNFWGGAGAVSLFEKFPNPAFGTEAAVELRHYFNAGSFSGFNVGLYAGLAYMNHPDFQRDSYRSQHTSVGFVPGLKLTYKHKINNWLVAEPYLGLSTPWYDDNFSELSDRISRSDPGFYLTIGFRIGFNKILGNN